MKKIGSLIALSAVAASAFLGFAPKAQAISYNHWTVYATPVSAPNVQFFRLVNSDGTWTTMYPGQWYQIQPGQTVRAWLNTDNPGGDQNVFYYQESYTGTDNVTHTVTGYHVIPHNYDGGDWTLQPLPTPPTTPLWSGDLDSCCH